MFIKNNTIHFPDSPREQALLPWLEKNAVQMPAKHDAEASNTDINIDNRHIEPLIAEGLVYVEANSSSQPVIRMVYKSAPKVREIEFRGDWYSDVPTPETYSEITLKFNKDSDGYSLHGVNMYAYGEHICWQPYTNMYNPDTRDTILGERLSREVCTNDFWYATYNEASHCKTLQEIVNRFTATIDAMLTTRGNNDLSLPSRNGRGAGSKYDYFTECFEKYADLYHELGSAEAVFEKLERGN